LLRLCRKGFKIGHLFADDREIAECLFLALTSSAKGEPVFLDMPDINPESDFFVRQYNLQPSLLASECTATERPISM
jgi:hypothetical protein